MVKVLSNTAQNNLRTVVITRPLIGATEKHITFDPQTASLNLITAFGKDEAFAYHVAHAPVSLSLITAGSPQCVCDLGETGSICAFGGERCQTFTKRCNSQPGGLLEQKNP